MKSVEGKITLEFTPEEVKRIIKEYVTSLGYKCEDDVVFDVSTQFEGYGMAEHEVTRFRGVKLKVARGD